MADQEDRTEAASPRRLARARESGNLPLSRELTATAVLAAIALILGLQAPAMSRHLAQRLSVFLGQMHLLDPIAALRAALPAAMQAAAPFVLAALLAGAAAVLLQTNFLISPAASMPDLSGLTPAAGCGASSAPTR